MNTTTTNIMDSNTTLALVLSLESEADYSGNPLTTSERIDMKIAILEMLGYTYYSGVMANGVHGHTNGNTYTMVSPNREMISVVYLVRENGLVTFG